jgi:hypothetical protein
VKPNINSLEIQISSQVMRFEFLKKKLIELRVRFGNLKKKKKKNNLRV